MERSAELRASARMREGGKSGAEISVVICVLQVKLQIRGHFNHQRPGMRADALIDSFHVKCEGRNVSIKSRTLWMEGKVAFTP